MPDHASLTQYLCRVEGSRDLKTMDSCPTMPSTISFRYAIMGVDVSPEEATRVDGAEIESPLLRTRVSKFAMLEAEHGHRFFCAISCSLMFRFVTTTASTIFAQSDANAASNYLRRYRQSLENDRLGLHRAGELREQSRGRFKGGAKPWLVLGYCVPAGRSDLVPYTLI